MRIFCRNIISRDPRECMEKKYVSRDREGVTAQQRNILRKERCAKGSDWN
jgi:hypothetical protein